MAKRKRDVPVLFWVSAEELELIHQKMQQYGTENLSAYLRKMALDGYVVKLELPELKELVSLMRRTIERPITATSSASPCSTIPCPTICARSSSMAMHSPTRFTVQEVIRHSSPKLLTTC